MIRTLRETLPRRKRHRLERPERAAVLIPIVDDGGPLRLLLTRRSEDLPTHRGQVAFPGGFMLRREGDPVRTALRETREEIGLPQESVELLGLLDDFPTRTDDVVVTPVVGRISSLPPLTPQSSEVARIFAIPVADLVQPDRWSSRMYEHEGRRWRVHFFEHEGETLWGLSALIVLHLLELTPFGCPVPPGQRPEIPREESD